MVDVGNGEDLENEILQNATDYIFNNYDKPITLSGPCKLCLIVVQITQGNSTFFRNFTRFAIRFFTMLLSTAMS